MIPIIGERPRGVKRRRPVMGGILGRATDIALHKEDNSMLHITGLDHFVTRVRDLDRSLAFYHGVLGMPVENLERYKAGKGSFVSVRAGEMIIDLVPDSEWQEERDGRSSLDHFCLLMEPVDFAQLIAYLKERGVEVVGEPRSRSGAKGYGDSIYIYDPDNHKIELRQYT
jgi:catechol 2,3-dioxygenase-like lactoylglutathione lyase family enzyme